MLLRETATGGHLCSYKKAVSDLPTLFPTCRRAGEEGEGWCRRDRSRRPPSPITTTGLHYQVVKSCEVGVVSPVSLSRSSCLGVQGR